MKKIIILLIAMLMIFAACTPAEKRNGRRRDTETGRADANKRRNKKDARAHGETVRRWGDSSAYAYSRTAFHESGDSASYGQIRRGRV